MKKPVHAIMAAAVVAATTVAAQSAFDPDCVLYYDFETLDGSGKIVNLANPGTMDGTIVTINDLAPQLVEDSPAARLRQSEASGVYEASEKSLENYITSASSRRNGYVECTPTDVNWFSTTNFTIECYFKTENTTQTYTPLFRRWGGANVQVNLGIAGTAGNMTYNVSTNTDKQTEANIAQFSAGVWHHVAMVVDQTGETKTMKFYFDHGATPVKTENLPSNLESDYRVSVGDQSGKWYIAGANGGNSFDGKIDSLRVTLRALEPEEFLTDRVYGVGSTISYISFDDATANASSDYGALKNGTYRGTAPTYSDDVPGALIRDGVDGELITKHNAKSISFPDTTGHSWVSYGSCDHNPSDTYYLHTSRGGQYRTSGTIEFWMKSSQTDADYDTVLLSYYARNKSGSDYQPILIRFNSNHRLEFGFSASGTWRAVTATNVDVLDGKWRHVAFTFKPAPTDSSKMVATGYIDYDPVGTITCDGQLRLENNGYFDLRFAGQHGSSSSKKNYGGLIDELRISDVALEPSQFLRAENAPGLTIIFR